LDCGFFRIGSESYAEENESYGLATMRRDHVRLDGETIVFDYTGKGGQRRVQEIVDSEVRQVAELKQRRGGSAELLAYRNGRRWVDVNSNDVNDYLKLASGGDFSAKDFRTWSGTMLAAVALASSAEPPSSRAAHKRAINAVVKGVAFYLGNTPAVARSAYIDPRVFDRFLSGWTIDPALANGGSARRRGHPSARRAIEKAVLDLLSEQDTNAIRVNGRGNRR
jgi:DNA topoisomerase-1